MKKSVFISRELAHNSVLKQEKIKELFQFFDFSLLEISPIAFDRFPETDWIFFYSKNGIKHFFEQLKSEIPEHVSFATIGNASADFLYEEYDINPDFVGEGNPEPTAEAFLEEAKGASVLFPQAKNSRKSIQQLLKGQIQDVDLIVYDNVMKSNISIPDTDKVVLTSPMNASAYFNNKSQNPNVHYIALGTSTGAYLESLNISNYRVAITPTEQGVLSEILSAASSTAG